MRFDCHVHSMYGQTDRAALQENLKKAGLDGCVVFSQSPRPFGGAGAAVPAMDRLRDVLESTAGDPNLYPFFFVDAVGKDAVAQVDEAVRQGIAGFKIVCSSHYPYDGRAIPVYERVAYHGKPLMFHSGILYDGANASGNFNRPCGFEVLLTIPGLRFSLAHISWPWTDECVALFGKFNAYAHRAKDPKDMAKMYVDLTPGTPAVYRREALERLLCSGYDIERNLIWGTDNRTAPYRAEYAREVRARDEALIAELTGSGELMDSILDSNFKEFIEG